MGRTVLALAVTAALAMGGRCAADVIEPAAAPSAPEPTASASRAAAAQPVCRMARGWCWKRTEWHCKTREEAPTLPPAKGTTDTGTPVAVPSPDLQQVPEPGTAALLLLGAAGAWLERWRTGR